MIITPDMARRARFALRCPHCRAPIGARCINPATTRPLSGHSTHASRVEAVFPPATSEDGAA